ncbi:MAG: sigma-70 family RNA polymerase sigma factor [Planctomycetes bacterium]|nr:sigma-70 family RNA polymerase sigma factor [Planctomycetota bacterium]
MAVSLIGQVDLSVEDNILVWKFNRGSKDALRRIYEKFKDDLLGLAISLLRDRSLAEDVVHDVFVSFGGTVGSFGLSGTLKGYLSTCVANSARDRNRLRSRLAGPDVVETACCDSDGPIENAIGIEESGELQDLLARLPYEQCEVIVLHLHHEMRFREIAKALGISINTVQSRYGLDKLRSILNSVVTK